MKINGAPQTLWISLLISALTLPNLAYAFRQQNKAEAGGLETITDALQSISDTRRITLEEPWIEAKSLRSSSGDYLGIVFYDDHQNQVFRLEGEQYQDPVAIPGSRFAVKEVTVAGPPPSGRLLIVSPLARSQNRKVQTVEGVNYFGYPVAEPNGRWLAVSGKSKLPLIDLETLQVREIPLDFSDSTGQAFPSMQPMAVSSDGRWLAGRFIGTVLPGPDKVEIGSYRGVLLVDAQEAKVGPSLLTWYGDKGWGNGLGVKQLIADDDGGFLATLPDRWRTQLDTVYRVSPQQVVPVFVGSPGQQLERQTLRDPFGVGESLKPVRLTGGFMRTSGLRLEEPGRFAFEYHAGRGFSETESTYRASYRAAGVEENAPSPRGGIPVVGGQETLLAPRASAQPAAGGLEARKKLGLDEAVSRIIEVARTTGLRTVSSLDVPGRGDLDLAALDESRWIDALRDYVFPILQRSEATPRGVEVKRPQGGTIRVDAVLIPAAWAPLDVDDAGLEVGAGGAQREIKNLFDQVFGLGGRVIFGLRRGDYQERFGPAASPESLQGLPYEIGVKLEHVETGEIFVDITIKGKEGLPLPREAAEEARQNYPLRLVHPGSGALTAWQSPRIYPGDGLRNDQVERLHYNLELSEGEILEVLNQGADPEKRNLLWPSSDSVEGFYVEVQRAAGLEAGIGLLRDLTFESTGPVETGYILLRSAVWPSLFLLRLRQGEPLSLSMAVVTPKEHRQLVSLATEAGLEQAAIAAWEADYLVPYNPDLPGDLARAVQEAGKRILDRAGRLIPIEQIRSLSGAREAFGAELDILLERFGLKALSGRLPKLLVDVLYKASQL